MRILFVALACNRAVPAANQTDINAIPHLANEKACRDLQRVLPIQLLAVVGELVDAGHQVHWPNESLNDKNKERFIKDAQEFNPDILFFAHGDLQTHTLMASVAVKTDSVSGCQFQNEGALRPAREWCDALTERDISIESLLCKLLAGDY